MGCFVIIYTNLFSVFSLIHLVGFFCFQRSAIQKFPLQTSFKMNTLLLDFFLIPIIIVSNWKKGAKKNWKFFKTKDFIPKKCRTKKIGQKCLFLKQFIKLSYWQVYDFCQGSSCKKVWNSLENFPNVGRIFKNEVSWASERQECRNRPCIDESLCHVKKVGLSFSLWVDFFSGEEVLFSGHLVTLKSLINEQGGYVVFLVLSKYSFIRDFRVVLLQSIYFVN